MRRPAILVLLFLLARSAWANESVPPVLEELYEARPSRELGVSFGEEKRRGAMRLAAIRFGAQGGLARRAWEINEFLARLGAQLSSIYRFRELLIEGDGFTVMPPVLAETRRAFRLGRDRTKVASAERVLRIVEPERFVSVAPGWRQYLVRSWRTPEPPAAVLFPRSAEETSRWRSWIAEGWAEGRLLADDIFASDLDRLGLVFEGVVRWHQLHLARMVSAPQVSTSSIGVSGSANVMRIGESAAKLGAPAAFNHDSGQWVALVGGEGP